MNHQPSTINDQPLRGWVGEYFVRSGTHRFGPYFARYWKENGKTRKQYIKSADLEKVRAACQAYREIRKAGTRIRGEFNTQSGNLKWLHRMNKRLDKGPLRDEDWAFMHVMKRNGFNISGRPLLRQPKATRSSERSRIDATASYRDPIPNTQHRTPKGLMVPSVTKRVMNKFQKTVARINDERLSKETTRDKWKRWRSENESRPPAPVLPIDLPDWLSEDDLQQMVKTWGDKS